MKFGKFTAIATAIAVVIGAAGYAWSQASYPLPSYPTETVVGNADLVKLLPNGQPSAQGIFASAPTLAGYVGVLPTKANYLIGGDATTNLFQRGATGASQTTTVAYGGPDRWAYWSGTNTAITVSRDGTAADLPASGVQYGFKLARTAAQTGVVQSCMAQEIESANSYSLAGQTVELDFNAAFGANFSAASNQVNAYIISGTGVDEGMSKLAFGLNGGGGGSAGWTGQANATVGLITLASGVGRYAAVGAIPAAATEVGVAICFTPVGTAGANDYVAFSSIQLARTQLTANTTKGDDCSTTSGGSGSQIGNNAANVQCATFDRSRNNAVERILQQRYYYELDESATIFVAGACKAESVTVATCYVQFPVAMRAAPTMTYANGFATETTVAGGTLGACTTLATAATVASTAPSTLGVLVGCTAATVPAAGSAGMLYSNNGTGAIKANAEL